MKKAARHFLLLDSLGAIYFPPQCILVENLRFLLMAELGGARRLRFKSSRASFLGLFPTSAEYTCPLFTGLELKALLVATIYLLIY